MAFGSFNGTAFFGCGAGEPGLDADLSTYGLTAFFWVAVTSKESEANMKEDNIKVDGIITPLLKNSTTRKPGTKRFKVDIPSQRLAKDRAAVPS